MNINIVAVWDATPYSLKTELTELTSSCKTFAPNNVTKCHLIKDSAQKIRMKCNSRCACDQTQV